jgi:hypothetical protein
MTAGGSRPDEGDAMTDCREFRRWLDGGSPRGGEPAAREHARRCARCAREWEAALAIEGALRQRFATASDSFADRVMERVFAARAAAGGLASPPPRRSLPKLIGAALLTPNVAAGAALLLVPWLTGIDRWRHGLSALPLLGDKLLALGGGGPAVSLPPSSLLPGSLPILALPAAALALYLLYRLGLRLGYYVSELAR